MSDDSACIFCRIFKGEIPAKEISRSENVLVFADLNPQAPTHLLAIPRRHADNIGDFVEAATSQEVHDLFSAAAAAGRAAAPGGYRIVTNEGAHGGQTVHHLHLHVLGGRQMTWPPG